MKFIPYGRQHIDKGDIAAVAAVLGGDWLTQGPKIAQFEKALCAFTGARYAVAVANGTAALHIAALAAGVKPGDEVITSPITFAASANAVLYTGGKPVFADIQADTGNIDPARIEEKITRRTKAIIPVHFSGHPCEMDKISRLAKKRKLLVIEDAAHALGSEYKGGKVGNCRYCDMAILSFHPVKLITTGEGGAVLTNSRKLYEKLMLLRTHGITKDPSKLTNAGPYDGAWYHEMQTLGFNYRITDFQCALGTSQLKKLPAFLAARRRVVRFYEKELSGVPGLALPVEKSYAKSAWHLYPVRVKDAKTRKIVFDLLRTAGIGAQVHYLPVYLHPYYRRLGYKKGLCPNAERFYEGEISIPMFQDLKISETAFVARRLKKAFESLL
ncbi:MAG TPA: UDP-4-amino-4,6-dideoxy-N-acetyl-beta-L-altrosamine transaminase [Elusimicrobia bacterium]|nr:UDP-4-amino-4,6-dideoxy-N-acetyl-beta-L-altrosamine transaminase [Elusimicrobiota bacterium]